MGAHKNRRRMRPAPQGRAYREQRHYCHITIMVSSDKPEEKDIKQSKNGKEGDKSSGEKKTKAMTGKSTGTKAQDPSKKAGTVKTAKADKKFKAEEATIDENVKPSAMPQEESQSPKSTAPSKTDDGKNIADASDVKNVESQTPQERHENKPADQVLDNNQSST
jgi:hypothetical protein